MLDLDFVPPGIAEVEQVLELLTDPEAEGIPSRHVRAALNRRWVPTGSGSSNMNGVAYSLGVGPAADRRRGSFVK